MANLAVIGAQWGDEGKGKLVDYLTAGADYVVRFHGGNNAGHTLVVGGQKLKLSLIPSGVLHPNVVGLIGAGVVINPSVFLSELNVLGESGVKVGPQSLVLDREAPLILSHHIAIDLAREALKGTKKIGTTGRGIGPAYEERCERVSIRVADLLQAESLHSKLEQILELKNLYLKDVLRSSEQINLEQEFSALLKIADQIRPYVGNVSKILWEACQKDRRIVFEGAQGTFLDPTFGTVPFVTSSSTVAGAICTGSGVGPQQVEYVLGVVKAYSTRVGSGPFPTELEDDIGQRLRDIGDEYGTVTKRPRRCGWFDAMLLKRAVRINGLNSLAITKLDVLSGLNQIKICIKYFLDGVEIDDVPVTEADWDRVKPEYISMNGWTEDISGCRKWHELPANARLYLSTLSEIVGCPISIVSVGPDRSASIVLKNAAYLKNFLDSK